LRLQKPHKTQVELLNNVKRFNHIRCGRRWGKTTLICELCKPALEKGHPVGIWYPTYKDLSEVWKEVKHRYGPVIQKKDEVLNQITLITGGIIDFWSFDNPESGQGRKYARAIVDEAAKAKKLKEAFSHTIRPTLTDMIGDFFCLSRPKGKSNDFFHMEQENKEFDNWAFFHYTSYDNPYLDSREIDEAKNQLDKITFAQEYLAEYVDHTEQPFLYNWNEAVHVGPCSLDESLTVRLSFDFNLDPYAVTIYQKPDNRTVRIFDRIKSSSDIEQVCDTILSNYGEQHLIVTGDASGKARTGVTRGKRSYWQVVKQRLRLSDRNIRLRGKNFDLLESRIICNSALKNCDILIDPSCVELIHDCNYANVDEHGILVKDRLHNKMDFCDTFRYLLDAEFPDIVRSRKKYER